MTLCYTLPSHSQSCPHDDLSSFTIISTCNFYFGVILSDVSVKRLSFPTRVRMCEFPLSGLFCIRTRVDRDQKQMQHISILLRPSRYYGNTYLLSTIKNIS